MRPCIVLTAHLSLREVLTDYSLTRAEVVQFPLQLSGSLLTAHKRRVCREFFHLLLVRELIVGPLGELGPQVLTCLLRRHNLVQWQEALVLR